MSAIALAGIVVFAQAPGRPAEPPKDPNDKTPAPLQVDLWSHKDPIVQPMQKVRSERERLGSCRAVVHLADRKFVRLATPGLPTVNPGHCSCSAHGGGDAHAVVRSG